MPLGPGHTHGVGLEATAGPGPDPVPTQGHDLVVGHHDIGEGEDHGEIWLHSQATRKVAWE